MLVVAVQEPVVAAELELELYWHFEFVRELVVVLKNEHYNQIYMKCCL